MHTTHNTHLKVYLGYQCVSMMDDGLSVVTVPAVQLHTSAAQTEHLKRREGEDGRWGSGRDGDLMTRETCSGQVKRQSLVSLVSAPWCTC